MKKIPFFYSRVEFRKNDALEKRDRFPNHGNDWYYWDGKAEAFRSILKLMRKGPRIPTKAEGKVQP